MSYLFAIDRSHVVFKVPLYVFYMILLFLTAVLFIYKIIQLLPVILFNFDLFFMLFVYNSLLLPILTRTPLKKFKFKLNSKLNLSNLIWSAAF